MCIAPITRPSGQRVTYTRVPPRALSPPPRRDTHCAPHTPSRPSASQSAAPSGSWPQHQPSKDSRRHRRAGEICSRKWERGCATLTLPHENARIRGVGGCAIALLARFSQAESRFYPCQGRQPPPIRRRRPRQSATTAPMPSRRPQTSSERSRWTRMRPDAAELPRGVCVRATADEHESRGYRATAQYW